MGFLNYNKVKYGLITLIVFYLIFKLQKDNDKTTEEVQYEIDFEKSFEGLVSDKYLDKSEHNWPLIVLDKNQKEYIPQHIYGVLLKGDYIFKRKSSNQVSIYKSNDTLLLDYNRLKISEN